MTSSRGGTVLEQIGGAIGGGFDFITGGFFNPPPRPSLPPVRRPPRVPASDGGEPTRAELERRARQLRGTTAGRGGFQGTVRTGPAGIPSDTSQTQRRTLLGL